MNKNIYHKVEKLCRRFHTRDPFDLLDALGVIVRESDRYQRLKGFCFMSCKTTYVVINSNLSEEEKRIVAAHELGHVVLHKQHLKLAPMNDTILYNMKDNTEYEANLFAADLLLEDETICTLASDEESSYFSMCRILYTTPELMSFKLYSLIQRGHPYNLPQGIKSNFLGDF